MDAVPGGGLVAGWDRNTFGMLTLRVHTTDYPEIEAEGRTPVEACDRLIQHLVQAIDFTCEAWKYQPLGLALADARSFTPGVPTEPEPFTPSLDLTRPEAPARCPAAGIIKEVSSGATP